MSPRLVVPALATVAAVAACLLAAAPLRAQAPAGALRVLRHAPRDTVRPTSAFTITFDRPVAVDLAEAPDPARLVRLEPATPATVAWRTPASLVVRPTAPLAPGARYVIVVDTPLVAADGGRLARPVRLAFRVLGPQLIGSAPELDARRRRPAVLDGRGFVTLAWSTAIDTALLSRTARLELVADAACRVTRPIRLIVASVRPIGVPDERGEDEIDFRWTGAFTDPVAAGLRRRIELRPERTPPPRCTGALVLPSFDPNDRAELRWRVTTSPPFALTAVQCAQGAECPGARAVVVQFSAPVQRTEVVRHVRVQGATGIEPSEDIATSTTWTFRVPALAPRSVVRVTVNPALRDVWGRAWAGRTRDSLAVGDRAPALGWDHGLVTTSRRAPTVRLRHANIDSVEIAFVPVEPSRIREVVGTYWQVPDSVASREPTVRVRVALAGRWNEERTSEVPVPAAVVRAGAARARAWHVRVTPLRARRAPGAREAPGRMDTLQVRPFGHGSQLVLQVSDLAAHLRAGGDGGAVLVTTLAAGAPVRGATAVLRRRDGAIVARGTTDSAGVAHLDSVAAPPMRDDEPLDPDEWRRSRYAAEDWSYVDAARHETGMVVEVAHGGDYLVAPLEAGAYSEGWRDPFAIGHDHSRQRARLSHAVPWTSRDLYRPGETVHLAAVVRAGTLGALRAPVAGDSVRLHVTRHDPGADDGIAVVRDTVVRLAGFGTAADSFALRPSAALGDYTVVISTIVEGRWRSAGATSFRVAEFRPPSFRVSLAADSAPRWMGDSVRARVAAEWLFGAPMRGARVEWRAGVRELAAWEVSIPGVPTGWTIGEGWSWWDERDRREPEPRWESGTDTLDADGVAHIVIQTDTAGERTRPATLTLTTDVVDADRQRMAATASVPLHATDFYLATRDSAQGWWWSVGARRAVQVMAVRPDGRRVAGVAVTATVVRRRWRQSYVGESRWQDDTLSRHELRTTEGIATIGVVPTSEGSIVVRLESTDTAGRRVRATLHGWAFGGRWASWWGDNPVALPVLARRAGGAPGDTLRAGDSVEVRFNAPWRAEAWVTMEREGLLAERRVRVEEGEATVRLPVTHAHAPGVTLAVALVRQDAAWAHDSLHQRLRLGVASVVVSRERTMLTVAVTPARREWAPGDSAEVTIRVRDAAGRPARGDVTLWAVDEGVLSLTGWVAPDVGARLYFPVGTSLAMRSTLATVPTGLPMLRLMQAYGIAAARVGFGGDRMMLMTQRLVATEESAANYASLDRADASGERRARGGAPDAPRVRAEFRNTAFWRTGIVTGVDGTARVRVALPDNLTTWRLVAVAAGEGDAYGTGTDTIRTTLPLLVRAALPRFVRAGDSLVAGALLNARDTLARRVTVRASADGLVREDTTARTVALAGGRAAESRWTWRAPAGLADGTLARVRFEVTADTMGDAVEALLPARPTGHPRMHALSGIARGASEVRFALPAGIDPSRSRLVLRAGTTPLPFVRAAHAWLRAYPYACSEQLTSTGRSILALLELGRAGVADTSDAARLRAELQRVVDELARRQRTDGGIGYWSRTHWSTPSLTAQAGLLMLDARDAGVDVDSATVRGVGRYLDQVLREDRMSLDSAYGTRLERATVVARRLGARLAALQLARRAGAPQPRGEDSVASLADRLTWEDRLWLARLLAGRGDRDGRARSRALLAGAWRDVGTAGARVEIPDSLLRQYGFPSRMRPAARLLEATLAIEPTHPRLGALVEYLVLRARSRRDWTWNTQDLAASASALAQVARLQRAAPGRVRVRAGGRELLAAATGPTNVRGDSVESALDGLLVAEGDSAALRLTVESEGAPVFWVLTVREVPRERPVTPDARGLVVERWYERWSDGKVVTTVKAGELVRVHLRLFAAADREFVALEDALPAGLEAVDVSLAGGAAQLSGPPAERPDDDIDVNEDGSGWRGRWGGWWSPWEHSELRDDRVLFFARALTRGTYRASYVARATTAGRFVRPPARAEEMYDPATSGRSDGGWFTVTDERASATGGR